MQTPVWILAALLAAPGAHALAIAGSAASPSQMHGDLSLSGLSWAILVFAPADDAAIRLEAPGVDRLTNHTQLWWRSQAPSALGGGDEHSLPDAESPWDGPLAVDLSFGRGRWSSLLLVGTDLALRGDGLAELQVPQDAEPFSQAQEVPRGQVRPFPVSTESLLVRGFSGEGRRGVPVTVHASQLLRAEWHNATVQCAAGAACPDGAGAAQAAVPGAFLQRMSFLDAALPDGVAVGSGTAFAWIAGGAGAGFRLDGLARFPDARLTSCDPQPCSRLDGQTLTLQGVLEDGWAEPAAGRRLSLQATASSTSAFADEAPIPGFAREAAPAVGIAVALALALKAALALAVRPVRNPLDHPRRRALHDLILAEPGLSFRDLGRRSALANGALLHHLRALSKAGLVVSQPSGKRILFFENHGRYDRTWQAVAVLHDERARALLDWIGQNPLSRQRHALKFAHGQGWTRSATRKRLARLLAAGLIVAHRQGRAVSYALGPRFPPS